MKKICYFLFICLISCDQKNESASEQNTSKIDSSATETMVTIDPKWIANTKDPICGMPTKAGITDTIHYKNKVYGFCAIECKSEFAKSPEQYLADAQ
ncbi:MAG: YHS domain-containing protein [Chitinophagaceae bacterium]